MSSGSLTEREACAAEDADTERAQEDKELPKFPDGGWGWVVAISCMVINGIADGYQNCFGLIFVEILKEFQTPSSQTSLITGIFTFTYCLVGPLSSGIQKSIGAKENVYIGSTLMTIGIVTSAFVPNIWVLYITFGLFSGVGAGMMLFTAGTHSCQWFDKKRAAASGLAHCGTGLGTFILPLLTSFLINEFGWRGTCILTGGVVLQSFVFGSLLWKLPPKYAVRQQQTTHTNEITASQSQSHLDAFSMEAQGQSMLSLNKIVTAIKEPKKALKPSRIKTFLLSVFNPALLKNPLFLINLLSKFVSTLGYKTVMLFLPARAESFGLSKAEAALQVSVIGIMNIFGRLLFGTLSSHKRIKPFQLHLFSASFFVCAMACFFSYTPNLASQITFAVFFGLGYSCNAVLFVVELADSIGIELFSAAYGGIYFINSIAALVGPPFGGWLFDQTQSYLSIFVFGGVTLTISGAVLLFIPCIKKRQMRAAEGEEEQEDEKSDQFDMHGKLEDEMSEEFITQAREYNS